MKYGILILILILLITAAGCASPTDEPYVPAESAQQPAETAGTVLTVRYTSLSAPEEQVCILTGEDAAYLSALLTALDYDPMALCKCVPPIIVTAENGAEYGLNLSEHYACSWSAIPQGQACLTREQCARIQAMLAPSEREENGTLSKKD